jgi:uncharacterized protein YggU (UPF0235/DUF167 family)
MILDLHVQPGAARSEFAVPKRSVRILSGLKSRQKRVQIDG